MADTVEHHTFGTQHIVDKVAPAAAAEPLTLHDPTSSDYAPFVHAFVDVMLKYLAEEVSIRALLVFAFSFHFHFCRAAQ